MAQKGLGKGLSALFSQAEADYNRSFMVDDNGNEEVVSDIKIEKIYANPNQPRKVFDSESLQELANSIEEHGVIMPIIVNKTDKGFMIIAGERRFRASKLANKPTVPAIIKKYNEREIKEISLIENLQREDLNPIESANARKQLMKEYGMTQEELAKRIGKSRPAVANTLRLLSLPAPIIKMVANNSLSQGHARAMAALDEHMQVKLAQEVVQNGLSVRDVEQRVKDFFNPPKEKEAKKEKPKMVISLELKELLDDMQRVLGTKVNAIGNDNKGRIYIDYYSREDLDRIADLIEFLKEKKEI